MSMKNFTEVRIITNKKDGKRYYINKEEVTLEQFKKFYHVDDKGYINVLCSSHYIIGDGECIELLIFKKKRFC